jgi:diguanylate cyclase (GGDEF)-like protein
MMAGVSLRVRQMNLATLTAALCLSVCMLLGISTPGQTAHASELMGSPPVAKFVPNIGTPPSSLDISQDETSMIYVANAAGVLTFDGDQWHLTPMPNGDTVSALRFDNTSRMYVGGHNQFGYLERDKTGQPQFHDLTPIFTNDLKNQPFGGIYLIRVTKDGVFFEGTTHIFQYLPETDQGKVWNHAGRLGAMEVIGGKLIMQFRGEGLRAFEGSQWLPIQGSEGINTLTNSLLPMPGGGILSMSADGQWREFVDGHTIDFKMPDGFPQSSEFNSARVLADGTFAFASISGAIWIYNPKTSEFRSMQVAEGPIIEMRKARDGGILALTDLAVYHVGWPNDWTSIGLANGISGAIHRLRAWGDEWIALSNNGVYSTVKSAKDGIQFARLKYTDYDGFDLMVADADHAYVAENFKLLWVDRSHVIKTLGRPDLYPRILVRSPSHPDQMYVGTDDGLALFDTTPAGGTFRIDRGDQEETVRDLVELSPTQVLMGTARSGVRLVTFNDDRTQVLEDRLLEKADGIAYGQIALASVSKLSDGTIVASTAAGLYKFTTGHFQPLDLPGLTLPQGIVPVLSFAVGPTGEWAFGGQNVFHRSPTGDWHAEQVGNVANGYIESIAFEGDSVTLFGCANTILRNDETTTPAAAATPAVQLRTVDEIGPDSDGRRFPLDPTEDLHVPDDFNIAFHFALPDYSSNANTLYQARLRGRDTSSSNWQIPSTYRYRHLPPGEYTFQAAARDRLGRITETKPFHFVVLAPWYATLTARIAWAALAVAAIVLVVYFAITWRTRALTRQRISLEREVSDRTHELVRANNRLNELAHRDILTGLANRALFESRLQQACARAQRHAGRFAVLFVDLDQFKTINDSLGHEAGDRLLQEVSARLQGRLRVEDTLARWGGDEFMVLVEELESAASVTNVAQSLLEAASAPIKLQTGAIAALSTSVGVSIYPDDSTNVYELIRNADTAMYSAKQRGGNQWCFYASEMTVVARERLEVLAGLRLAVAQNDFVLHYQPLAEVGTNHLIGVEALLRWRRDGKQLVLPENFIAVAESTDLISVIGAWVIKTACAEAQEWLAADPEFSLAINISPRQLRSNELVYTVEAALKEFSFKPNQLILEVTESSIAAVGENAAQIVTELKRLGVRVALDDFGTGQSALASLKRFDFDILKIDRSFIRDTPEDRDDMEIAATIVAMGHTLGLMVVAEGVETEEQLAFLRTCRCDHYQGFLLSEPIPADAMSAVLGESLQNADA